MVTEQDQQGRETDWAAAGEFFKKYPITGGETAIAFFKAHGWSVEFGNRGRAESITFVENAGEDNPRGVRVSGTDFAVTKTGEVGFVAWVMAARRVDDSSELREIYARHSSHDVEITFDEIELEDTLLVFKEFMKRGKHFVESSLKIDPYGGMKIGRRFGKVSQVASIA